MAHLSRVSERGEGEREREQKKSARGEREGKKKQVSAKLAHSLPHTHQPCRSPRQACA